MKEPVSSKRDIARELARKYSTMTHDELDLLEEKQQAVEAAQIKVDRWKAEVDKVQAELDAVIANLTASPIDSTTTEE